MIIMMTQYVQLNAGPRMCKDADGGLTYKILQMYGDVSLDVGVLSVGACIQIIIQ